MQLYRLGWFLKDAWKVAKRCAVIAIALFLGGSVGWAGAMTYMREHDIHVDCTYDPPGFP